MENEIKDFFPKPGSSFIVSGAFQDTGKVRKPKFTLIIAIPSI